MAMTARLFRNRSILQPAAVQLLIVTQACVGRIDDGIDVPVRKAVAALLHAIAAKTVTTVTDAIWAAGFADHGFAGRALLLTRLLFRHDFTRGLAQQTSGGIGGGTTTQACEYGGGSQCCQCGVSSHRTEFPGGFFSV